MIGYMGEEEEGAGGGGPERDVYMTTDRFLILIFDFPSICSANDQLGKIERPSFF